MPTISWPGMSAGFGWSRSPSTMCRSVRHTAHAATRIRTWPSPGRGSATSVRDERPTRPGEHHRLHAAGLAPGRPTDPWRYASTARVDARIAARSAGFVAAHTPSSAGRSIVYSRHSSRTGHSAQMCLAVAVSPRSVENHHAVGYGRHAPSASQGSVPNRKDGVSDVGVVVAIVAHHYWKYFAIIARWANGDS